MVLAVQECMHLYPHGVCIRTLNPKSLRNDKALNPVLILSKVRRLVAPAVVANAVFPLYFKHAHCVARAVFLLCFKNALSAADAVFPVYFKNAVHLSPASTNMVLAVTPLFLAPFSFLARYCGHHIGALPPPGGL